MSENESTLPAVGVLTSRGSRRLLAEWPKLAGSSLKKAARSFSYPALYSKFPAPCFIFLPEGRLLSGWHGGGSGILLGMNRLLPVLTWPLPERRAAPFHPAGG